MRMRQLNPTVALALCATLVGGRGMASPFPIVNYTLRVNPADTTGFDVAIRIRNARDTVRLVMAAHPEYDDRYWRYVREFRVESPAGALPRVEHSAGPLWTVIGAHGNLVVRYRILFPPDGAMRAAYRPFVRSSGALVGDVHSFMYLLNARDAPSHVTLEVPSSWTIATGLEPTRDPHVFSAHSAEELLDSPILMGALHVWTFTDGGVPHHVAYWPALNASPFDTTRFVDGIERIVHQTLALFGTAPYPAYTFLLQDRAYGSLEHANSVTVGIPSADLSRDPGAYFEEIAHEYFHAWNMMRIRPAVFEGLTDRITTRSSELWWSEGATMFYADLLVRRAGLETEDSTRIAHVANLLASYYSTSGNRLLSPERVSRAAYGLQGAQLGDNTASTHLQGELITIALDLMIRDATHDRRMMDDVMRAMMARHSGPHGFASDDVEREVNRVCGCGVSRFFAEHVHGSEPLDTNRLLALIGLAARVDWTPVLNAAGTPRPDLRVFAWQAQRDSGLRLMVLDTASIWEKAGLHTGDSVVAVNGVATSNLTTFRAAIGRLRIDDTVAVEVMRRAGLFTARLAVQGYNRAVVTIRELPSATASERARRAAWLRGS